MSDPTVTVLITTYNRSSLLARAMASVLKQSFSDFEILLIDDASTDDTPDVVAGWSDERIRYLRNSRNQGAQHGDRVHLRRALTELSRGRYFIYLCDDDFWLPPDLLERQVGAFEKYPSLSMAMGGHAHVYDKDIGLLKSPKFVSVPTVSEFTVREIGLLPSGFMPSLEFLELFSDEPVGRNILDGATLFSRNALLESGVFSTADGSRWQAGYELKIGPASMGDVFYIDEACVVAEIDSSNASFKGTQRGHYLDCVCSVRVAFRNLWAAISPQKRQQLRPIKRQFIRRITDAYLRNRLSWNIGGLRSHQVDHGPMFRRNVTPVVVAGVLTSHLTWPTMWQIKACAMSTLGSLTMRSDYLKKRARKLLFP